MDHRDKRNKWVWASTRWYRQARLLLKCKIKRVMIVNQFQLVEYLSTDLIKHGIYCWPLSKSYTRLSMINASSLLRPNTFIKVKAKRTLQPYTNLISTIFTDTKSTTGLFQQQVEMTLLCLWLSLSRDTLQELMLILILSTTFQLRRISWRSLGIHTMW